MSQNKFRVIFDHPTSSKVGRDHMKDKSIPNMIPEKKCLSGISSRFGNPFKASQDFISQNFLHKLSAGERNQFGKKPAYEWGQMAFLERQTLKKRIFQGLISQLWRFQGHPTLPREPGCSPGIFLLLSLCSCLVDKNISLLSIFQPFSLAPMSQRRFGQLKLPFNTSPRPGQACSQPSPHHPHLGTFWVFTDGPLSPAAQVYPLKLLHIN